MISLKAKLFVMDQNLQRKFVSGTTTPWKLYAAKLMNQNQFIQMIHLPNHAILTTHRWKSFAPVMLVVLVEVVHQLFQSKNQMVHAITMLQSEMLFADHWCLFEKKLSNLGKIDDDYLISQIKI